MNMKPAAPSFFELHIIIFQAYRLPGSLLNGYETGGAFLCTSHLFSLFP
jgi:hypothetical protein